MSKILNETRERSAFWFSTRSGSDTFPITIPPGETYHSCRLTILTSFLNSQVKIAEQPTAGASGTGQVVVNWRCADNSMIRYQVEVFSSPALPPPGGAPEPVTRQMTGFLPDPDGFNFINYFPPVPDVVFKTPFGDLKFGDASKGLCGGMVYAALDYFNSGLGIPDDKDLTANQALFDYVVKRLLISFDLPFGILRYIELMNPKYPDAPNRTGLFGAAPVGRSWSMIRQEWPAIKQKIDAGQPCPLGLILLKSADLGQLGQNHQVMAYGYDQAGDDLTLFIYDPNRFRDNDTTLRLNLSDPLHPVNVTYSTGQPVYSFFATSYAFSMPPGDEDEGRILLFVDRNFHGKLKDIENAHHDLSVLRDVSIDNRVSSFVILNGNWSFYQEPRFQGPFLRNGKPLVLGPGSYAWVEDYGIKDDAISSLRVVSDPINS